MSEYTGNNLFEKIGAFIPGYKGYSDREGRRDTDKLLRIEVAGRLERMKTSVDSVILHCMDAKQLDAIRKLDKIKRNCDTAANQIRYATRGESGFFDIVQVNEVDLDRLYQYDLSIGDDITQLDTTIKDLVTHQNVMETCANISKLLEALSNKITDRETVITEVS